MRGIKIHDNAGRLVLDTSGDRVAYALGVDVYPIMKHLLPWSRTAGEATMHIYNTEGVRVLEIGDGRTVVLQPDLIESLP